MSMPASDGGPKTRRSPKPKPATAKYPQSALKNRSFLYSRRHGGRTSPLSVPFSCYASTLTAIDRDVLSSPYFSLTIQKITICLVIESFGRLCPTGAISSVKIGTYPVLRRLRYPLRCLPSGQKGRTENTIITPRSTFTRKGGFRYRRSALPHYPAELPSCL
jgi:hypothetical protein